MTPRAKVKITVASSTKQAYNLAMLGTRTLKHSRDVSYDQKMTLRGEVMVNVTMTCRTASLLAMLYITWGERYRAIMALLFFLLFFCCCCCCCCCCCFFFFVFFFFFVLFFLHANIEDWSDYAGAQADLSLSWAHTSGGTFHYVNNKIYDYHITLIALSSAL